MVIKNNLIGLNYGRLKVLSFAGMGSNSNSKWLCLCQCGNEKVVYGCNLKRAATTSCGCYHKERILEGSLTHGQSRSKAWTDEYRIWTGLFTRCYNKKYRNYKDYGGRGIRVCERWCEFENFFADMGSRPSKSHSIDRINNDGDYEPGNCRWATRMQQAHNKRPKNNNKLTWDKVHEIRSSCLSKQALANKYKVNKDWIVRILNNKVWVERH